ncbi:MAG: ribosome-binding factor ribosome-binding factor [Candidatus Berkelbacteria bacterium]|nr:ribosome-binding factor ribosome-binding factor [Candidatus Berkelbacteria bacterium]
MARRIQKVSELIKQQLAELIIQTLPENLGLVTLIDVHVTSDLKNAWIYVSCFDKSSEKETLKILSDHSKEFQHILGRKLEMRYTPKLEFMFDDSLEKINRVENILKEINKTQ